MYVESGERLPADSIETRCELYVVKKKKIVPAQNGEEETGRRTNCRSRCRLRTGPKTRRKGNRGANPGLLDPHKTFASSARRAKNLQKKENGDAPERDGLVRWGKEGNAKKHSYMRDQQTKSLGTYVRWS